MHSEYRKGPLPTAHASHRRNQTSSLSLCVSKPTSERKENQATRRDVQSASDTPVMIAFEWSGDFQINRSSPHTPSPPRCCARRTNGDLRRTRPTTTTTGAMWVDSDLPHQFEEKRNGVVPRARLAGRDHQQNRNSWRDDDGSSTGSSGDLVSLLSFPTVRHAPPTHDAPLHPHTHAGDDLHPHAHAKSSDSQAGTAARGRRRQPMNRSIRSAIGSTSRRVELLTADDQPR